MACVVYDEISCHQFVAASFLIGHDWYDAQWLVESVFLGWPSRTFLLFALAQLAHSLNVSVQTVDLCKPLHFLQVWSSPQMLDLWPNRKHLLHWITSYTVNDLHWVEPKRIDRICSLKSDEYLKTTFAWLYKSLAPIGPKKSLTTIVSGMTMGNWLNMASVIDDAVANSVGIFTILRMSSLSSFSTEFQSYIFRAEVIDSWDTQVLSESSEEELDTAQNSSLHDSLSIFNRCICLGGLYL